MKYFFRTLIICFTVLSVFSIVHADACGTLTTDNYQSCCVDYQVASSDDCNTFKNQMAKGDTTPMITCSNLDESNYTYCCSESSYAYTNADNCANYKAPQQVGSGSTTQTTNPLNGNSTVSANGAVSYQSPNTASNASTSALASCSAIKFNTILDIAIWVKCIIGVVVIPGIFLLAFVVFLWGVFKFIRASSDKDKQESKQFIYMGLIGLFVMVGVWGIIGILTKTLGFGSVVPTLQTDYLSTSKASTTTPAPASTPTSSKSGSQ